MLKRILISPLIALIATVIAFVLIVVCAIVAVLLALVPIVAPILYIAWGQTWKDNQIRKEKEFINSVWAWR